MSHYHVERMHADNEVFEGFSEAVLFVVAELNEGLTITAARNEFNKSRDIVRFMNEYMELGAYQIDVYSGEEGVAYKAVGNRSWNITECNSFRCNVSAGGSW